MRKLLLAIGAAAICSAGLAAQKDDVAVKITGCVHDGAKNSFVFTNVVDLNESATAPTSVVYWLSSTDGLKAHVGHKIEVSGTYSPSRDAGKTAKIKIDTDADDGETTIAVENGIKKAEMDAGTVGTTGVKSETTIEKPYRRLEVKSIKMIAASCQ